jgi:hypothetical protein
MSKLTNIVLILTALLASASFANAQEQKAEKVKEFLKESEFGLQRKKESQTLLGQKGFASEAEEKADISDIVSVDLIDPFQNITIKGTQTELAPLDDGIELDEELERARFAEEVEIFKEKIQNYFDTLESKDNINPIAMLNSLTINRIISSPVKYVTIKGKNYSEGDIIKVRVNTSSSAEEFEGMLNAVEIQPHNEQEEQILMDLKTDALSRYTALTTNTDTALNIVKVEVKEIVKHTVSFLIDGKSYKIVMDR